MRERQVRALRSLLGRLTLGDVEEIYKAIDACWQEQMNGNMNSQIAASDAYDKVMQRAFAKMLDSDVISVDNAIWPENRILIGVEGGVVQGVSADRPSDVRIIVRDLDNIEAGDPDPFDQDPSLRELADNPKHGAW